ncbi:hypothetical protein SAMN05421743_103295 [Thalassobacillus cyri]|uniref:Uncharacterized protein n=2 Tax=Thalassobacillus cyri TaxID=571932 RepID=A0A1H3ZNR0_9BACI|nr:hypothetical protein SAMN05421743_103295 [Thalassobacillus cyri]
MKKKWMLLMMSFAISTGILTACNVDDNEMNEQPEDIDYDPVRYDNGDNDMRDNDMRNNDMNNNQGPDMDTDPRDVRDPDEGDTPNNMDEEEPDPDEEPSEERRGQ